MRGVETLEYVGAAPIYDSGTSLWFSKPNALINPAAKVNCKPFKSSHEEQIKLVTTFDWLDLNALSGIDEELWEITQESVFIDAARRDFLCAAVKGRVGMLTDVVNSSRTFVAVDDSSADVREDIAYSGTEEELER